LWEKRQKIRTDTGSVLRPPSLPDFNSAKPGTSRKVFPGKGICKTACPGLAEKIHRRPILSGVFLGVQNPLPGVVPPTPRTSSLTNTAVCGAKPASKPQKLFDGNGLFLFVAPSGAKSWRVKYRIQDREKLLTLGTYPQRSLKEARETCMEAKKQISGGIDPSAEKKVRARSAHTSFGAVARE
jgi:hypothetical protein